MILIWILYKLLIFLGVDFSLANLEMFKGISPTLSAAQPVPSEKRSEKSRSAESAPQRMQLESCSYGLAAQWYNWKPSFFWKKTCSVYPVSSFTSFSCKPLGHHTLMQVRSWGIAISTLWIPFQVRLRLNKLRFSAWTKHETSSSIASSISKRWNERWINWKERVKNVCWELWKIRFHWKAIANLVQPCTEAKKVLRRQVPI